jgi:hypothetical protein
MITGTALNNSSLWIFIDSSEHTPGTYKNHRGIFPAGGYFDLLDTTFWYDGELKITSIDTYHASGTFWFNASHGADTIHVTNGKFDVSINYGKIPH